MIPRAHHRTATLLATIDNTERIEWIAGRQDAFAETPVRSHKRREFRSWP